MTRPILFRSRASGRKRSGSASMMIRQRGSDWSHLRHYTNTDDIRDIAWNKMKSEGLSVRVREMHGDYHIISYIGSTPYDGFYTDSPADSRTSAMQKSQKIIESSARYGHYHYSEYSGATGLDRLVKMKPSNALIFISNTEVTADIRLLAYHNDVIYLDITHPWESSPTPNMLFSGQQINIQAYLQEYHTIQADRKNTITKIGASYIAFSTTTDVTNVLNIFFKNRYTHGQAYR